MAHEDSWVGGQYQSHMGGALEWVRDEYEGTPTKLQKMVTL
jgi:hypothetical protein